MQNQARSGRPGVLGFAWVYTLVGSQALLDSHHPDKHFALVCIAAASTAATFVFRFVLRIKRDGTERSDSACDGTDGTCDGRTGCVPSARVRRINNRRNKREEEQPPEQEGGKATAGTEAPAEQMGARPAIGQQALGSLIIFESPRTHAQHLI